MQKNLYDNPELRTVIDYFLGGGTIHLSPCQYCKDRWNKDQCLGHAGKEQQAFREWLAETRNIYVVSTLKVRAFNGSNPNPALIMEVLGDLCLHVEEWCEGYDDTLAVYIPRSMDAMNSAAKALRQVYYGIYA